MPRDANGTYTLPVEPGIKVDATWFNAVLSDIAQALTDSFAVDGSIAPDDLTDTPVAFQQKLGIDQVIAEGASRIVALESRNSADIGSVVARAVPVGFVPDHHLVCAGQAVSRTTYAKLFAKIGTTFGAGDGSTTFNLPDMRDRLARGWDNGRGVDAGRSLGSVQTGMVPSHTHTASTASAGGHSHTATTSSAGAHTHGGSTNTTGAHTHSFSGTSGNNSVGHTHSFSATTSSAGSHAHTFSKGTSTTGTSGSPTNNYVNDFGTGSGITTNTAGAHTHSVGGTTSGVSATHTHAYSGSSATGGAHTHTVTVNEGGAHTHTTSSASAGGHTHTVTVNNAGGESRVRNYASRWFIKFE